MLQFDLPKNQSSIIKVIGVGGGGSNAVTHMYRQGIKGVDFIICNTDAQAMESSPVPTKIQLGANLTGGLGAGAVPSIGKNSALENVQDIRAILEKGTKMLFITAGLGGGTGTGAAPVIASVSRELGILTVGIVTLPFSFEGRKRKQHAEQGIAELNKYVDALLIICNDKLRLLFGDQRLSAAFGHADDVLTNAAKGIAEIITVTGYINVDFEDVKTVMKDSGVAIMGSGMAQGENRALKAIEMALNSPLLNDNNIEGANNLLLYISSGKEEITMDEVTEITDYIQEMTKNSAEVIWGNGIDEALENNISVTIIATGFDEEHKRKPAQPEKPVTVKHLYEEDHPVKPVAESPVSFIEPEINATETKEDIPIISNTIETPEQDSGVIDEDSNSKRTVVFNFEPQEPVKEEEPFLKTVPLDETHTGSSPTESSPKVLFKPAPSEVQQPKPMATEPSSGMEKLHGERVHRLKELSEKLKTHPAPIEDHLAEIENVPAYLRRNVGLADVHPSSESLAPKYSLSENTDKSIEIKTENSYLHNNVD
jgi:cell division protein FtsZ